MHMIESDKSFYSKYRVFNLKHKIQLILFNCDIVLYLGIDQYLLYVILLQNYEDTNKR